VRRDTRIVVGPVWVPPAELEEALVDLDGIDSGGAVDERQ
jgi:hypothetical protein